MALCAESCAFSDNARTVSSAGTGPLCCTASDRPAWTGWECRGRNPRRAGTVKDSAGYERISPRSSSGQAYAQGMALSADDAVDLALGRACLRS